MNQMNGFFYLLHKPDGTYLKLIPNKNGGAYIKIDEITDYLASKHITDYNKIAIINVLNRLHEPTEVKLTDMVHPLEQETMVFHISSDALSAVARFYPPSEGGKLLTYDGIVSNAVSHGMKFGLLEDVVNDFLKNRVYCTDIVIAKALLPVQGKSASIKYYFNNVVTRKPKMNADGTVDFHQLDLINHVKENDVLAELTPMEAGKPGIDVTGKLIRQDPVRNCTLRHSSKIHVSEDGLRLISEVDGHVYLVGDKVTVSDMYEIKSDIDLATGDIDYSGSVTIRGNVRTGFTVKAKGTIFVEGVVEGATLISDAGIVLSRGMQGMNRGKLITSGDVVAKFIENAVVECEGSVTAEAILHSKVFAGKEIEVTGKRGLVTGGELHSAVEIRAKTAGSTMGTNTVLEVGIDPKVVMEYHKLEKVIRDSNSEINKLKQIIDLFQRKYNGRIPADKIVTYHVTKETHDKYITQLQDAMERYDYLTGIIDKNDGGSIIIEKTTYSGCKIVISNIIYYVRQELFCKRFCKDGVDIKVLDHIV